MLVGFGKEKWCVNFSDSKFSHSFAAGFFSTKLHGGSYNDALVAGFKGALIGGISAGIANRIGALPVFSQEAMEGLNFTQRLSRELLRAGMHGSTQGGLSIAQGGKFIHGFAAGAMGSLAGSYVPEDLQLISAAAIGGTAASISGGKFANGAITGAYVVLFNHAMHSSNRPQENSEGTLVNNSKKRIYYKPDNEADGDWDALPLEPGESTNTTVDAINVGGQVYKIRNGYNYISVNEFDKVLFDYPLYTPAWPRVENKSYDWMNQQLFNVDGTYRYYEYPSGSGNYVRDTQWWNIFNPNNQILDPRK